MKIETFMFKVAPVMMLILFCMSLYAFYLLFTIEYHNRKWECPKQEINHNNYGEKKNEN